MSSYPQIDYTSRDFLSLVQDMTALIDSRVPEWTSRSQNDFGMVMIELFAYCGDILSYYGDRIANEAFLATATQRESVLEIAKLLDYSPSGPVAASVGLRFTNTTGSYAWVLRGTQVVTKQSSTPAPNPSKPFATYQLAAQAPVYFETTADVLVPPNGSATVTAIEGVTYNEQVGVSDGTSDQDFPLFRTPVINHSVTVAIGTTKWTFYERLVDAYPSTRAYTLETDGDNVVHVVFGDGANGAVPPIGQTVNVTYRVGGGKRGNVTTGAISRIVSTVPAGIKVLNPAPSVGGGEAETIDQIKANAPRSLFTLQRAVSLSDYVGLALRVGGVAKVSIPPPAAYSSVTMYIAPTGGGGFDTSGNPTAAFTTLKNRVYNYLADKIPLGTTLTMADPTYVPVKLQIAIVVKAKYKQEDVRQAVIKTALALFAFNNVVFHDTITLKDLHTALATVPGIQSTDVQELGRDTPATIDIDTFDTAPNGSGWTADTSIKLDGTASAKHVGTGSAWRSFTAKDLSNCGYVTLRSSYTGPGSLNGNAYLVTTLSFTDINGVTWSLGSKPHGNRFGLTAGDFAGVTFPLNFPDDPDVFDATQVVRYDLTTRPKNIPNSTFWLDMFQAYEGTVSDIVFDYDELPAPFYSGVYTDSDFGKSSFNVTATGGLPR